MIEDDIQKLLKNTEWIRSLIGNQDKFEIEPACQPGENYGATLYRLSWNSSLEDKKKSVILKRKLEDSRAERKIMDCNSLFENERIAYLEVLPILQTLQKARLPFPNCFKVTEDDLVLEDLKHQGYKTVGVIMKNGGLDLAHTELAIKAIAVFHAHSFILKERDLKFNEISSLTQETIFKKSHEKALVSSFWENSLKIAQRCLLEDEDFNEEAIMQTLKRYNGKVLQTLRQFTEDTKDEFTVLCHGDLWINNLMFRYDFDSRPMEVRLLDLQCMRISSCALDIVHLLCTSTEKNLLRQHLDFLLDLYYDNVSRLTNNIDFTVLQLKTEVQSKIMFGLLLSFQMNQCSTSEPSCEDFELSKQYIESETYLSDCYKALTLEAKKRICQITRDVFSIQNGDVF